MYSIVCKLLLSIIDHNKWKLQEKSVIHCLCSILNLTSAKAANKETVWSWPKYCCINGVEQIDVALQIFSEAKELHAEKAFSL